LVGLPGVPGPGGRNWRPEPRLVPVPAGKGPSSRAAVVGVAAYGAVFRQWTRRRLHASGYRRPEKTDRGFTVDEHGDGMRRQTVGTAVKPIVADAQLGLCLPPAKTDVPDRRIRTDGCRDHGRA